MHEPGTSLFLAGSRSQSGACFLQQPEVSARVGRRRTRKRQEWHDERRRQLQVAVVSPRSHWIEAARRATWKRDWAETLSTEAGLGCARPHLCLPQQSREAQECLGGWRRRKGSLRAIGSGRAGRLAPARKPDAPSNVPSRVAQYLGMVCSRVQARTARLKRFEATCILRTRYFITGCAPSPHSSR